MKTIKKVSMLIIIVVFGIFIVNNANDKKQDDIKTQNLFPENQNQID